MEAGKKKYYENPAAMAVEVKTEGIICQVITTSYKYVNLDGDLG